MSKKTDDWGQNSVDGVINACDGQSPHSRRSPRATKQRNYNILNNKIDKRDFEYVLNPFNLSKEKLSEFQLPASLQPYDVLSPTFMQLFGEEAKRFFNPIVRASNESVLSSKLSAKKKVIADVITQMIQARMGGDEQNPEPSDEELEKYLKYSPKDMRESVADKLLNHYIRYLKLEQVFQTGWKDAMVAGEELYRIDQVGDGPVVKRVNTLEIDFILPNNSDYIDEAEMIHELNYMSLSEVIDEFYEELSSAQIDGLETDYKEGFKTGMPLMANFVIPEVESIYHFRQDQAKGIPVHRVRWKSFKKMGYWYSINPENNEEQSELVDEYFVLDTSDKTQRVEWFWISEYWEGIRLGDDIYLQIRPRKNQFRSMDNPSICKSGYVGTLYSALNSQSVSLMDRLVPWLYLYLIIWYNTELLMSTNMGKIAAIDVSLIPDGWEPEKWMYYAKSMKIAFVNSYNEGNKAARYGAVNNSTQTKTLDMELGQSIQYNIQLLEFIEQKIDMTSGISRQRKGSITSSELVGNTERAVTQSAIITEDLFTVHNNTKVRVCTALLEVAKDCLEGKSKTFQYITDDMSEVLFSIDGDEFTDADYDVFITNSARDLEALQAYKANLNYALNADKLDFSQIADIFTSNSIADIKNKTKSAEQERVQQQQQAQQQAEQAQQQMVETQIKMEQQKLDLQKYIADSNNETKIRVAEMNTYIGQQSLDLDNNGIPDPIEIADLALKERDLDSKKMLEHMKIQKEETLKKRELGLKGKELDLKEKEMKSKEKIEKLKSDTAIKVAKQNKTKYD